MLDILGSLVGEGSANEVTLESSVVSPASTAQKQHAVTVTEIAPNKLLHFGGNIF